MTSFVSKTISRLLVPNLEKDLTKAVSASLQSSAKMTDCFLAPTVYGFEKQAATSGGGIGQATSVLEKRIGAATGKSIAIAPEPIFQKVHYPAPGKGLFN